jgi:phosphoenolpyruvate carboxykinase (ATP)
MDYDFGVYVLNTGHVGGSKDAGAEGQSWKDVKIPHTSAIVKAIAEGTITWEKDPTFGYLVANDVPDFDDPELLKPRKLYERQGRADEYERAVEQLKSERREYMHKHEGLAPGVVEALG